MFRILCFGRLAVLREGAPLAPGAVQPRRLGLLALLAAGHDRAQGRERLASLLWPDSDEERSRGSLAQALYALRRDLGSDEAILGVRELKLNADFVSSDLWEFEAHRAAGSLERAAECYTGPFLDGFQLPGLDEFDRWLEQERAAWATRHLEVVERIAVDAEKRDDRAGAIRWWRRAAGQEPHNARIAVRLMRALARSGDRAGAIRQSEIYAALIERDLELPPDPTVLREAEQIRQEGTAASVTGDWPAAESPAPAEPARPPPEHSPPSEFRQLTPPPPPPHAPYLARRWPMVVATAAIVVAVVGGALWSRRNLGPKPAARRVLVVPPRNNTGDSTYSLVGPMVAEWITRGLSETGLVDVIDSRTMLEATQQAGDEASLRDLALGAGVGTLIVGSVYKDGDSLRIEVRLTDANTGRLERSIDPVSAPLARPTAALEPLRQRVTGGRSPGRDSRLYAHPTTCDSGRKLPAGHGGWHAGADGVAPGGPRRRRHLPAPLGVGARRNPAQRDLRPDPHGPAHQTWTGRHARALVREGDLEDAVGFAGRDALFRRSREHLGGGSQLCPAHHSGSLPRS